MLATRLMGTACWTGLSELQAWYLSSSVRALGAGVLAWGSPSAAVPRATSGARSFDLRQYTGLQGGARTLCNGGFNAQLEPKSINRCRGLRHYHDRIMFSRLQRHSRLQDGSREAAKHSDMCPTAILGGYRKKRKMSLTPVCLRRCRQRRC